MRANNFFVVGIACVLLFLLQSSAKAQYLVLSSSTSYNSATQKVNGVSQTTMDYETTYYYRAKTKAYIYTQNPSTPLTTLEATGTNGQSVVTVQTQVSASQGVQYNLRTEHSVLPIIVQFGQYYDYWNYYYYSPAWTGVSQFGSSQTIYGCQKYQPYPYYGCYADIVYNWIWMGNTNVSITIPAVSITNPRSTGNIANTTQTALLGADIVLGSTVSPTGGSYAWTFTGPYSISGGSSSGSSVTIRSTDVGTITAQLTYTANGVPVAPQFTINVVIPTLQSFTGQLGSALIDSGNNNCGYTDGFWRFKLGCTPTIPGMHFTTTVHAPNFISDPTQSGIKYVQAVSTYRKQFKQNLLCSTGRSSPTDVNSGWQLDTEDPYVFTEYPVHMFSEGNDLTMLTVDYPNQALTFIMPFDHVDSLEVDDRFQMYVVYFTFDPRTPPISRPLGKLDWNFGGFVVFDRPGSHQIRSNYVTPANLTGQATSTMVAMQGNVKDNPLVPCPGAPPMSFNHIDSTRFFVRQHYLDFLAREPDLDGWNWWTSEIAECAFDLNCLHTERIHIGHAFFLVGNTVVTDPDLANPPGTPGFNAATYNRAFVRHCYLNYLRREPDLDGWNHWTDDLNADGNYWHIIDAFQLAPQYRQRFCTPPLC